MVKISDKKSVTFCINAYSLMTAYTFNIKVSVSFCFYHNTDLRTNVYGSLYII